MRKGQAIIGKRARKNQQLIKDEFLKRYGVVLETFDLCSDLNDCLACQTRVHCQEKYDLLGEENGFNPSCGDSTSERSGSKGNWRKSSAGMPTATLHHGALRHALMEMSILEGGNRIE